MSASTPEKPYLYHNSWNCRDLKLRSLKGLVSDSHQLHGAVSGGDRLFVDFGHFGFVLAELNHPVGEASRCEDPAQDGKHHGRATYLHVLERLIQRLPDQDSQPRDEDDGARHRHHDAAAGDVVQA